MFGRFRRLSKLTVFLRLALSRIASGGFKVMREEKAHTPSQSAMPARTETVRGGEPGQVPTRRILDYWAAGAWNEILLLLPQCESPHLSPHIVTALLDASLHEWDLFSLKRATRLAISCNSNENQRIRHANILARWGRNTEALFVLLGDPSMNLSATKSQEVQRILGHIQSSMDPEDLAFVMSQTLARRFRDIAEASDDSQAGAAKTLKPIRTIRKKPTEPPKILGPLVRVLKSPLIGESEEQVVKRGLIQVNEGLIKSPPPEVMEFENVFLHEDGSIWNDAKEIFRLIGEPSLITHQISQGVPTFDTLIAACHRSNHSNPYHWFADMLPILGWRLDLETSDVPIAIGSSARPWIEESLQLAARAQLPVVRISGAVFARRLFVPMGNARSLAHQASYQEAFSRLTSRIDQIIKPAPGPPIYISRRDSKRRPMKNEALLEDRLASRGIRPVILSEMSLAEKIRIIRDSPFILGPHGAGLAYLVFASTPKKVLEILPLQAGGFDRIRLCMTQISLSMGHSHHLYLEKPVSISKEGEWELSIDDFLRCVDSLA
jgi:Glycosyltransferase 61